MFMYIMFMYIMFMYIMFVFLPQVCPTTSRVQLSWR
eukprot:COSAG06_NODE_2711_length_6401_cov_343.215192_9_plen_36_part_00